VKWDPARTVYLDDGQVNYQPNVNDLDSRLLAGGPDVQALFARLISSSRYVSAISTESVDSNVEAGIAQLLSTRVRGRLATLSWNGNLAADTYDVSVKRGSSPWGTGAVVPASRQAEGAGARPCPRPQRGRHRRTVDRAAHIRLRPLRTGYFPLRSISSTRY
jgi:hypothetical protein